MIVNTTLVNELFRGFYIQRWNDKIRPLELIEMDKHAHKMQIAYCIGKYEESAGNKVNWNNLILGGIFEFLRRIIISDIKSPIYYKIRNDNKEVFLKLSAWVYSQLEGIINHPELQSYLKKYLLEDNFLDSLSKNILDAAHKYASYWEFRIIKHSNPDGYQIHEIERDLMRELGQYLDLDGMKKIISRQDRKSVV